LILTVSRGDSNPSRNIITAISPPNLAQATCGRELSTGGNDISSSWLPTSISEDITGGCVGAGESAFGFGDGIVSPGAMFPGVPKRSVSESGGTFSVCGSFITTSAVADMISSLISLASVGTEISVKWEELVRSTAFAGAAGPLIVVSSLDADRGGILPDMRDGRILSAGGSVTSFENLTTSDGAAGLEGFGSGTATGCCDLYHSRSRCLRCSDSEGATDWRFGCGFGRVLGTEALAGGSTRISEQGTDVVEMCVVVYEFMCQIIYKQRMHTLQVVELTLLAKHWETSVARLESYPGQL
jgi:hypothetical protein